MTENAACVAMRTRHLCNALCSRDLAVYTAIFTAVFGICSVCGIYQYAAYVVFCVNLVCYVVGYARKAIFFSSFLIGNELVSFANILVGLLAFGSERRGSRNADRKPEQLYPVLLIVGFVFVATAFVNAIALGTYMNTIVTIGYYSLLGILFCGLKNIYTKADVLRCIKSSAYCEGILVLISVLQYGFSPSDWHVGSFGNAHFLGIWCCFALLLFGYCWTRTTKNRGEHDSPPLWSVLVPAILVMCLYLSDTKAPVICGGLLMLLAWVMCRSLHLKTVIVPFVTSIVILFLGIAALANPAVEHLVTQDDFPASKYFDIYVYDDETSIKYDYYYGTMESLLDDRVLIFGYGLGQYGSRAANLFGYESIARQDNAVNRLVKQFVDSNMLESYARFLPRYNSIEEMGNYSVLLISPFSSFVSFLAEGGLIGLAFLCLLLRQTKPGKGAQFAFVFFVGCCLLDMYLDHIQLTGLLVFIFAFDRDSLMWRRCNEVTLMHRFAAPIAAIYPLRAKRRSV